jgi:hypothetical protein
MVDVLAIIIFYMVESIGFQNLYMLGLNKMCLPTPPYIYSGTALSDYDISFGLLNLFTYFDMPFG